EAAAPRPLSGAGTVAALNLASRLTGFVRVVATAAALGIVALGDTYQGAVLVSNVLFELLAGGLLFSVLVPTFVTRLERGDVDGVRALAGVLTARALVVLAVVAAAGIALGPLLVRALTSGASLSPEARDDQVALGSFLLWFVMPQLLLYAVGAVTTAMLQATRRFTAAALAPICNNAVVIVTMVAFAAVHDPSDGVHLTGGERALLGIGTLAGTVAMTALPVLAARRAGLGIPIRWSAPGIEGLGDLVRKGAWGAGDIGLNQVLVAATIVFAGRTTGGVIAYQTAFAFFLLPHAVLGHPVFTTLFPHLSARAAAGDRGGFARDLAEGLRSMLLLLLPASALLAAIALPVLSVVEVGELDGRGASFVAAVLAAYLVGVVGYSTFFLLTRASYALDDARSPTMVYLWVTVVAIGAMAATTTAFDGRGRVVALGLVHGAAVTIGSLGLHRRVRRRLGEPVPVLGALARGSLATAVGAGAAWGVVTGIGWDSRTAALASVALATAVGAALYLAVLAVLRSPEVGVVRSWGARIVPRQRVTEV
ncbi:MAG TPA: lipid II flippase MurJ, partial [Acidimicrobiales bacterium]|nr:lipid II flippase MurJ [Acidimicrobiales bacterium]